MENQILTREYLKPLLWDVNLTEEELGELFSGKKFVIRGVTRENLYVKLLASYNWYTLLKIAGKGKLREMLTDEIIIPNTSGKIFLCPVHIILRGFFQQNFVCL